MVVGIPSAAEMMRCARTDDVATLYHYYFYSTSSQHEMIYSTQYQCGTALQRSFPCMFVISLTNITTNCGSVHLLTCSLNAWEYFWGLVWSFQMYFVLLHASSTPIGAWIVESLVLSSPASKRSTENFPSAESLLASTQPAEPAPTINRYTVVVKHSYK